MTKLILVRHGSTSWTKEKRYQGHSNIPLSKEGIGQAKKIADRLKKERIDICYTSKLKRAVQTAQEIVKFHKLKPIKQAELNERSYGKWEGLTEEEVKKKYLNDYKNYEKERYKSRPTQGQSFFDLRQRVGPFIKKLVEQNKDKAVLIVSHNGTLRIIICVLMGYNEEKIPSLYLNPTSLTIIDLNKGKSELKLMNCNKHNN